MLSFVKTPAQHEIYIDNAFSSYALFIKLRENNYFATGTVRENRMAKRPLKSNKIINKMDRGGQGGNLVRKMKLKQFAG